jgi:uncharacterized protein YjbI with pentapeptide repeats
MALSTFGVNDSNLDRADFTSAVLTNVAIVPSSAVGANFTGVRFVDGYLAGANLTGAVLTNVTWANTLCPDATNSDDNGGTCVGHLTP